GLKSRLWVRLLYFKCKAALHIAVRHCKFFGDCNLRSAIDFAELRKRSSGVGGVEPMPCTYFGEKNREMKAKKERGRIIIPKDKFKEFVEFQKMLPVEKIEKLLYPFMHSNFRQASYLIKYGV
ncbi:MAG: hypothetical protein KAT65_12500, partial [Methanophagales archaeon]|nr:hypothetical protein [Methanophagales archaeon]